MIVLLSITILPWTMPVALLKNKTANKSIRRFWSRKIAPGCKYLRTYSHNFLCLLFYYAMTVGIFAKRMTETDDVLQGRIFIFKLF